MLLDEETAAYVKSVASLDADEFFNRMSILGFDRNDGSVELENLPHIVSSNIVDMNSSLVANCVLACRYPFLAAYDTTFYSDVYDQYSVILNASRVRETEEHNDKKEKEHLLDMLGEDEYNRLKELNEDELQIDTTCELSDKAKNVYKRLIDEDLHYFDSLYLYDMPAGWRYRFGLELCEDIRNILLSQYDDEELTDNKKQLRLVAYHIDEVKEKFGSLRWYWSYNEFLADDAEEVRDKLIKKLDATLDAYEQLSLCTCCECGNFGGVYMTRGGWISPFCTSCVDRNNRHETLSAYSLAEEWLIEHYRKPRYYYLLSEEFRSALVNNQVNKDMSSMPALEKAEYTMYVNGQEKQIKLIETIDESTYIYDLIKKQSYCVEKVYNNMMQFPTDDGGLISICDNMLMQASDKTLDNFILDDEEYKKIRGIK